MTKELLSNFFQTKFNLSPSQLALNTPLFTSGLLDSMALIELISFLENSSQTPFNALEMGLENLDTMEKIVVFMDNLGNGM